MNLNTIKSQIKIFINSKDYWLEECMFLSEQYQRFTDHWMLDHRDLSEILRLSCDISIGMWHADSYQPITSLIDLVKYNQDMVRSSFADLLDESKDLSGRVDRFLFHIEWIQKDYNNATLKRSLHYHDVPTAFKYLSMTYPQSYAFYDQIHFDLFLNRVEAKSVASVSKIDRYCKVTQIIKRFLIEMINADSTLKEALRQTLNQYPMILVYLYYRSVAIKHC